MTKKSDKKLRCYGILSFCFVYELDIDCIDIDFIDIEYTNKIYEFVERRLS